VALSAFDSDAFDTDAFDVDAFLFAEAGVLVPDVVGDSQAAGTATLEGDGFVVAVATAYSSTVPAGDIISQDPVGGAEAPSGSTVTITVSLGDQPVQPSSQPSGGFWFDFDHEREHRARKRREEEEREQEARALQDKVDAEIAMLLARQDAEAERKAELDRLQSLVKAHSNAQLELSDRAKIAYVRALTQANFSALEALDRELQRQIEEEDFAVLMLLLNGD
jgi:hypothetical protein